MSGYPFRHYEQGQDVGDDAREDSREHHNKHPEEADYYRVDFEILTQSATDTGENFVGITSI